MPSRRTKRPQFRRVSQGGRLPGIALFVCAVLLSSCADRLPVYALDERSAGQAPGTENWAEVVRETMNHEIAAQAKDQSLWCYRKLQEKDGKQETYAVCQAKGAEIARLVEVNGKELDEKQREAENQRIENLVKNKRELAREARRQHEDAKHAEDLMKLISNAFLFRWESRNNDQVTLKFTPNPEFRPSGHEAEVYHHMEGTLTLDVQQKRLAELSGRLVSAVKFGGGLLGHLDKGGTFLVKQQAVAPGCWQVTTLDVRMNGRALFFKTIAVRQKEMNSQFRPVPASTTIEQLAEMTKAQNTQAQARN
jgi:hypothetical protein